jgi:hypothetical protein
MKNKLIILSFLTVNFACVKKNSCECKVGSIKYRPSVPTNSYFKARKQCKEFENNTVDSSGIAGIADCRIKLL